MVYLDGGVAFTTDTVSCISTSRYRDGMLACLVDLTDPPPRPADVFTVWKGNWVDFDGSNVEIGSQRGDPGPFVDGEGAVRVLQRFQQAGFGVDGVALRRYIVEAQDQVAFQRIAVASPPTITLTTVPRVEFSTVSTILTQQSIGQTPEGISEAARPAMLFGLATLVLGLVFSFLMPRHRRSGPHPADPGAEEFLESLVAVEPLGEVAVDPRMRPG